MNEFEKRLFEKIKNKEDLDFNELQFIEKLLYLASIHERILNIQLDLIDNDLGLEYTRKRGKDNEQNHI